MYRFHCTCTGSTVYNTCNYKSTAYTSINGDVVSPSAISNNIEDKTVSMGLVASY